MGKHSVKKSARQKTGYAVGGLALAGAASLVVGAGTAHADPDWGPVIACESGGRPTATNPSSTASGLFQFLDSSWRAYGGGRYAARAKDATPAQQYEIANHAYAMSGLTPWTASKGCWGGKVSTNAPKHAAPAAPAAPLPVATSAPKHAKPEPVAAGGWYTVQPGDCLSEIAAAQGLDDWHPLWDLNRATIGDDPNTVYTGQKLKMPA